jgi:hypothetical protein
MEMIWNFGQQGETNSIPNQADYSIYTLQQLFKLRYWFDSDREPNGGGRLEEEIRKRCAHIRERISQKESAASGSDHHYRPYGLMFGAVFLVLSSGPFVAVKFLDAMSIMPDVAGDYALLTGLWAVLTLPFAAMIYLIGAMVDAERVVKWFNL